jgi:hypothetical protein
VAPVFGWKSRHIAKKKNQTNTMVLSTSCCYNAAEIPRDAKAGIALTEQEKCKTVKEQQANMQ